jgi:hypothetical protein
MEAVCSWGGKLRFFGQRQGRLWQRGQGWLPSQAVE